MPGRLIPSGPGCPILCFMLDRMDLKVRLDTDNDIRRIVDRFRLQHCTRGTKAFYESSEYGRFEGIHLKIEHNILKMVCSIHKVFFKSATGILDNSGSFTISQARAALCTLFNAVGVDVSRVTVTYFEIGLNMRMSREADEYIRLVSSVGENRKLFNDANFEENRQKTTEKSRCRSKVLKMYDKSFEYRSKGKAVEANILRLETSYRRQKIPLSDFFNDAFVFRLVSQFSRDWNSLSFPRQIIAEKGTKGSQIEKARRIMEVGRDAYLAESRKDMEAGIITPKQYRCIREFVQHWNDHKKTFRFSLHGYGVEFKNELCRVLRTVSG